MVFTVLREADTLSMEWPVYAQSSSVADSTLEPTVGTSSYCLPTNGDGIRGPRQSILSGITIYLLNIDLGRLVISPKDSALNLTATY